MTIQTINVGAAPNDGTGDPLRTAMQKSNSNFVELYADKAPKQSPAFTGQIDLVNPSATSVVNITSASSTFQIYQTAAGVAALTNYASGGSLNFGQAGAGTITFGTNGVERARITAAGNFGIGTIAPGAELEVAALGGDSDCRIQIRATPAQIAQFGVSATSAFIDSSGNPFFFYGTSVAPGADNTQPLGGASTRWSVVYAGTGTINTSDARLKRIRGAISNDELDAWGDVAAKAFQYLDAIEIKGDAARMHVGYLAQDVAEAFASRGIDVSRHALFCRDEITRKAKIVETRMAQATESVEETYAEIEIRDGAPVQVQKSRTVERPMFDLVAVVDEAGAPAKDGDRPLMHPVPVMIEVEREVEIDEPAGDRLGLRYDQCAVFEAAWLRREFSRLAARLDVLGV